MADSHLGTVYYRRRARDLWARSYWVQCIHCESRLGPFPPIKDLPYWLANHMPGECRGR